MSQSTDAYLSYGIELGDELTYTPEGEEVEHFEYEAIYALEGILSKYNLEILTHCSADYPMFILCYTPSRIRANRGYPEQICLEQLMECVLNGGVTSFRLFMSENPSIAKQLTLTDEDKPVWILCSDWC